MSAEKPKLNTSTKAAGAPKARFNSFNLDYERPILDDFVHGKFLTLKYTGKGERFQVAGKEVLDFKQVTKNGPDGKPVLVNDKPVKEDAIACSSEIKYITNVRGRNIEAKFDSNNGVRLWSNLGEYDLGERFNFFAKIKTNKKFDTVSGNVHAEHKGKACNAHVRFDVKRKTDIQDYFFNNKVVLNYKPFRFGYQVKLSLTQFKLRRYNAFVHFNHNEFDGFVEHISKDTKALNLGEIILAGLYRKSGHQVAAKFSYSHKQALANKAIEASNADQTDPAKKAKTVSPFGFTLAGNFKINNKQNVRVKADQTGELALSHKVKCCDNFSIITGTKINLLNPGSFVTGRTIPIPLGVQVDFIY
mmetsp:Transcript_71006/g.98657  ORF Transcript_71006/g.98657 Transcript_71006/m.98657 type:complete len:360 (-) Transcript_71006:105-1184(-)